jgi:2,5-diketo-D-gluconate reductase B
MTISPTLGSIEMPQMGFGTWNLGGDVAAIQHALDTGYRHIDTADIYGSHDEIASAIRQSGIARSELFIVTKLWSHSLAPEKVGPAVERFLRELNMDYIDLLLIHWPSNSVDAEDTLSAMQDVQETGAVRALGVSNFDTRLVERCLEAGYPLTNNQVEYNLNHRPDDTLAYCLENAVTVTAYSPLERGSRTQEDAVAAIAEQQGASREQVLLAWLMAKGMVVIPRSSKPAHIEANWASLDLKLSEADIQGLDVAQ